MRADSSISHLTHYRNYGKCPCLLHEPKRISTSGLPFLPGNTMAEKRDYFLDLFYFPKELEERIEE